MNIPTREDYYTQYQEQLTWTRQQGFPDMTFEEWLMAKLAAASGLFDVFEPQCGECPHRRKPMLAEIIEQYGKKS